MAFAHIVSLPWLFITYVSQCWLLGTTRAKYDREEYYQVIYASFNVKCPVSAQKQLQVQLKTRPEVSEGDPPITSLIQGVPSEETDRQTLIKVSISNSRMDIILGPSLLSVEYFL